MTTTLATATPSAPPSAPAAPGSGPTATPPAAATPVPPVKPRKVRTWIKTHVPQPIFAIVLLVLVILTIAVLGTGGLATNKFVFVNTFMQWTLVIFNLLIMAYPIFLLGKQVVEKRDHWKVNLITRGVVILLSFLFTIFWLTAIVRLQGGAGSDTPVRETYAGSLWSVPILGPFVFPVAAVALHALAAYLLVRYASENPRLKRDKAALPHREAKVTQAQVEVEAAQAKIEPRDERVKKLKKRIDKLTPEKDKAVKDLQKAQDKFDAHKVVTRQKAATKELAANEEARATKLAEVTEQLRLAKTAKDATKTEHQSNAHKLNLELSDLQKEQHTLEAELKKLEPQVEQLRKQFDLEALTEASDALAEKLKTKSEKLEKATKRLEKATTAFKDASATHTKLETKRDKTQARIDETTKALKNVWRDVALWAGSAGFCLFLAFVVLYAAWYGWKLLAFAF